MVVARVAAMLAVLFLAACSSGSETSEKPQPECEPSSSSRPTKDLGVMIGSGPARPVGISHDGEVDFGPPNGPTGAFKGEWGGGKILWAVAPGTGEVTVRGHEVGGPAQLRFGDGEHPKAELVLAAPPEAMEWSDFPGFTRVKGPGCYAFEVTSPAGTERIVFRFV